MEELITVIVNVYNGEKYIKKCLNNISNQTYKNLEILVINDGSKDNTLLECENYKKEKKDERIKIITTENLGLSMSRNVGIENAKGEYLYFIDVDDVVTNDVIEYLYNLCKKYNTTMSSCLNKDVYDYNFKIKNKKEKIRICTAKEMIKKILLIKENAVTTWNKLMKKELFKDIRFENRINNDVVIAHKLMVAADKIAYSNQIKYFRLRNRDSISLNLKANANNCIDGYNVVLERYEYLKNIYSNFVENEIGLIYYIAKVHAVKNEEVHKFLKEQNARKVFKEHFTFRFLTSKLRLNNKIKIILYMINPNLVSKIAIKYEKIWNKLKYKI